MHIKKNKTRMLFYLLLVLMLSHPVSAADNDDFVIKTVTTQLNDTVYFLNVVYEINLPDYIIRAFEQGFDLPLYMELEVLEQRRFWFDKEVVYIKQQFRLQYHPLLDSVSVLNVNSGSHQYYSALDEALSQLSVLLSYPYLDKNSLQKNKKYQARLRFGIDKAELPIPLKSTSLWQNNWGLVSDWHEWDVRQ